MRLSDKERVSSCIFEPIRVRRLEYEKKYSRTSKITYCQGLLHRSLLISEKMIGSRLQFSKRIELSVMWLLMLSIYPSETYSPY